MLRKKLTNTAAVVALSTTILACGTAQMPPQAPEADLDFLGSDADIATTVTLTSPARGNTDCKKATSRKPTLSGHVSGTFCRGNWICYKPAAWEMLVVYVWELEAYVACK